MSNILEDIFFGELNINTHEMSETIEKLVDIEHVLMSSLKKEDKQLFIKYINLCSQVNAETAISKFKSGFKVCSKLIIDVYRTDL